ncbi:interleukin-15 receptor subunit alpha isoform X6 [Panthera tigris]|uniref:interleukin-15 receptor subunit alpha isoform X6 n=1 Tax=Panthera tigris TaxID=9694 RepID=UPI001C6F817F|nr:interleukin-15 receptor subunit alpha isoform X6 [Panthera tigris]
MKGFQGEQAGRAIPGLLLFSGVTCPPPTSVEYADIRVKSYKLNSTERYTCNTGFKRKAGTSTLTECVLNKTTNTAHWTIPNLKCITSSEASLHPQAHKCHVVMLSLGDPSLTHLKPSSTEMPAGVTPEPESTSLSGKEPAFTSKSDSTVATKAATEPGSRLIPSKPPAAGTTGVINNEPSRAPAQTTAKALEHTPSASQETPASLLCSLTSVLCLGSVSWKRKSVSQRYLFIQFRNCDCCINLSQGVSPMHFTARLATLLGIKAAVYTRCTQHST